MVGDEKSDKMDETLLDVYLLLMYSKVFLFFFHLTKLLHPLERQVRKTLSSLPREELKNVLLNIKEKNREEP